MTARPVRGAGGKRPRPKAHNLRPGAHLTGRGTPRLGYLTEFRATAAAHEMTMANGHEMGAYKCATCGLWHLGRGK